MFTIARDTYMEELDKSEKIYDPYATGHEIKQ